MNQGTLFPSLAAHQRFLPKITKSESDKCEVTEWDIPYTIGELSYLTHSHYRYYGKFPSVIAGQLLNEYPPPTKNHYVLDNFCGSGTTLVEAKLRDINSYGVDVSWISVLVSNVKTRHVDTMKIRQLANDFLNTRGLHAISVQAELGSFPKKWFNEDAIASLSAIQSWLLSIAPGNERDFLLVAFLGIVRRVSKAFDAEVRPHVNPEKKQRDVIEAYAKKIKDMIENHAAFQSASRCEIKSECLLANNLALPKVFDDGRCYLVISHPPYLNSFNYRPVFSLEFFWGAPFESDYATAESVGLIAEELVAHPANESINSRYFSHLERCFQQAFDIQKKGGKLAIVIGDCTRNGKLVPVIEKTVSLVETLGYKLTRKNYRTTHYGLGKYAYKTRADYHGDAEEKRDAIIVFEK